MTCTKFTCEWCTHNDLGTNRSSHHLEKSPSLIHGSWTHLYKMHISDPHCA